MNRITMWGRGKDRGVRWLVGLAFIGGVGLVSPGLAWSPVAAFADQKPGDQPCGRNVVGSLGIIGIDCRGDCTFTLDDKMRNRAWSFSVEPRITEITPNGPAARALQIGDTIVAIDGFLITTTEGGRRFANIEPDQVITIRFRREGRIEDAVLRVETRCAPAVEGLRAIPLVPSRPSESGSASEPGESWPAPRIRIQRSDTGEEPTTITVPGSRAPAERTVPKIAEGRIGMRWACGPCSETGTEDGRRVWEFSGPLEVIGVEVGGPAERAGIRLGDRITAVNGKRIESRQGAEAFASLQPGQATLFTVIRRNGRKLTVTVVPVARDSKGNRD